MNPAVLGAAIRRERKRQHMTLRELADATGYVWHTIWRIEKGRFTRPSVESIDRIAKALGVSVDRLLARAKTDGR